jgi:hypothetical protein
MIVVKMEEQRSRQNAQPARPSVQQRTLDAKEPERRMV